MGLYRLSRDFQFGVCNLGEPRRASPYLAREGEHFYRKEKEVERTVAKKKKKKKKRERQRLWLFMGWVLNRKEEETLLPVGLCYHIRAWKLPLLRSQFYFTEVFILLNFYKRKVLYQQSVNKEKSERIGRTTSRITQGRMTVARPVFAWKLRFQLKPCWHLTHRPNM